MPDSARIVKPIVTLDRGKHLDEAIFLSMCGLDLCREKQFITGVVRLEMAVHKLQHTIKHLYKKHMPQADTGDVYEDHY